MPYWELKERKCKIKKKKSVKEDNYTKPKKLQSFKKYMDIQKRIIGSWQSRKSQEAVPYLHNNLPGRIYLMTLFC